MTAGGVALGSAPDLARRVLPAAGFVLILIALFSILPDLAVAAGWTVGSLLLLSAFALVRLIDRFVYPICPACAPAHSHDGCAMRLHGFAGPLMTGAVLHNLFDGYALAAGLGEAFTAAVVIHKVAESLALGALLRAAVRSRVLAFGIAFLLQAPLFAGAMLEAMTRSEASSRLMPALLALGGGVFLYLGLHAVHGIWRRRLIVQT